MFLIHSGRNWQTWWCLIFVQSAKTTQHLLMFTTLKPSSTDQLADTCWKISESIYFFRPLQTLKLTKKLLCRSSGSVFLMMRQLIFAMTRLGQPLCRTQRILSMATYKSSLSSMLSFKRRVLYLQTAVAPIKLMIPWLAKRLFPSFLSKSVPVKWCCCRCQGPWNLWWWCASEIPSVIPSFYLLTQRSFKTRPLRKFRRPASQRGLQALRAKTNRIGLLAGAVAEQEFLVGDL